MLAKIYFSFPIQLLIYNLKKNQMLLLFWFLLFGFVSGLIGRSMGIHYLFLDPEYLNKVTVWSFLIMGVAVGGFIMAYNITGFILDSYRFSFLSRVNRPLTKYSINNGIIPIAFIVFYVIYFIRFQLTYEFNSIGIISLKMIGFLGGITGVIFLFYLYFRITNKDVFYIWAKDVDKKLRTRQVNRVNVMMKIKTAKSSRIRVDHYIDTNLKIIRTQNFVDYDKETVTKVFDYYHLNAVIIDILILLSILVFGFFREIEVFEIPAAASTIMLLTILIMITGALSHWLKRWAVTIIIVSFFIFNNLAQYEIISSRNEAYGINYDTVKTDYSIKNLTDLSSNDAYESDKISTTNVLEKWRNKFPKAKKPKMIFLCVSGGGQRAALWTLTTLQKVNKELDGKLLNNTVLITGASGGLVGAAYFREIYLRSLYSKKVNLYDETYLDNISRDILNPVILSMVISNPLMSFQKFDYEGFRYKKDRGYAFEKQLNKNTENFLEKPISAYRVPEANALIPMMILSPTVINDGRRIYISPQNVSYMNTASVFNKFNLNGKVQGIEFKRFFKIQNGDNLRFTSALRMSATFPYITPNVMLPSNPPMEIMDAGLSDNFGVTDAIRFLFVFQDWVKENTSGVIFVSIRDTEKDKEVEVNYQRSAVQDFFTPIGSLYKNWDNLQDINNDNIIEYASSWMPNVDRVDFEYKIETEELKILSKSDADSTRIYITPSENKASLSWRLTSREKESIKKSIDARHNKAALIKLKALLNQGN